jgi:glycosyltransferase involved in cell wall biosynthesis
VANILILTDLPPADLTHGGYLRTVYLAKELAKKHNCYLATFGGNRAQIQPDVDGIFRDIKSLPLPPEKRRSPRRHFRWSNSQYIRLSRPKYFSTVICELQSAVTELKIDLVIASSLLVAEYAQALGGVTTILDDYDCHTLNMEREYEARKYQMTLRQRSKLLLHLARTIAQESQLTRNFQLVTTIATADQERLKRLNRLRKHAIAVIPNGVTPSFLAERGTPDEFPNAIAFWGVLDYQPNLTAVLYFYEKVFKPFLADKDLTWFIVGKNPGRDLCQIARSHKNVRVTGYVKDLFSLVRRVPIMVNPIVMGSGLKNKVLEAFAMRRAVISTRMGIQGIAARDGEEFIMAETPQQFAEAIFQLLSSPSEAKLMGKRARELVMREYTWERVGEQMNSHIQRLLRSESVSERKQVSSL